jgi:hypothetical protein
MPVHIGDNASTSAGPCLPIHEQYCVAYIYGENAHRYQRSV